MQTPSKLQVLGLNGHPLGVNGTEICVFEQAAQVCLGSLLQRPNGRRLKSEV